MTQKILPALLASIALISACGPANAGLFRTLKHGIVFGAGVAVATKAVHAASERCHNVMDPEKGHKVLQCTKAAPVAKAPLTGLNGKGN